MRASWTFRAFGLAVFAFLWVSASALAQHTLAHHEEMDLPETSRPDTRPVGNDRIDQALERLQADADLQTTRPEWESDPTERNQRNQRNGPNPIAQFFASLFQAIAQVAGYLLILLIIIAIFASLYLVLGERFTLRGKQKEKDADPDLSMAPDLRPEQKRARALLEDADALAAQGKFAEAVHLLLFRSIDDIQSMKGGIIDRSLTSREIGALGVLPEPVRDTLLPIIRIVERSFFGGQDVTETGWREARASYEHFAFGAAWT